MVKNHNFLVYTALISIQVLFGVNFSASKVIVERLDPVLWSNIRFFLAGLGMLMVTLILKRKHPVVERAFVVPLLPLSLMGMALGQGLFLFGLEKTTSINTAIITSCIPILTLLIVVIRKQESLNINKLIGFILAFSGVIVIRDLSKLSFGNDTFLGDFLVFLGALCFAIYISYARNFLRKYDGFWVTSYLLLISGVLMTLFNISKWLDFSMPVMDSVFISSAIYSILGATLLTYFLNNWVLKHAPSGQVALFIYLQPVVAGVVGWLFLNEEVTLRMAISSFLIMSGLLVTVIRRTPLTVSPQKDPTS
jgi:drug/metabolite transporter (DMT)-like permease